MTTHLWRSGWFVIFLAVVGATLSFSAAAISLHDAKAQGLVGEQPNGYLGAVGGSASADVKALVNEINEKRKNEYQAIATRNNASLQAVEALAGKKAIEKTAAGQYIKSPSGEWIKK